MPTNLIKWKKHPGHLAKTLKASLPDPGHYTDCTLICVGGQRFPCHRALLSAHSDFFDLILREHPAHVEPVILMDEADAVLVENLVKYLYTGVVAISTGQAKQFMQYCSYLRIKGLMSHDMAESDDSDEEEERATITLMEPPPLQARPKVQKEKPREIECTTDPVVPDVSQEVSRVEDGETELPEAEDIYTVKFLHVPDHSKSTPRMTRRQEVIPTQTASISACNPPPRQEPDKIEAISFEELEELEDDVGNEDEEEYYVSMDRVEVDEQEEASSPSPRAARKRPRSPSNKTTTTPIREDKRKRPSEGYTQERLQESIEAVCGGYMNLSCASEHFAVPKSVLWRNLKKRTDYNPNKVDQNREQAKVDLANGVSITKISAKYNIPVATLYRDKQRLISAGVIGQSGDTRTKAEMEDALRQAVEASKGGMAQSEAAKTFNVPKSTLWRRMKKLGFA